MYCIKYNQPRKTSSASCPTNSALPRKQSEQVPLPRWGAEDRESVPVAIHWGGDQAWVERLRVRFEWQLSFNNFISPEMACIALITTAGVKPGCTPDWLVTGREYFWVG